jgi:type IV fimbrial biogenesis protein FimT
MQSRLVKLRAAGVTLIELMVVLAIAAILSMIAAPSLTGIIKDSRLRVGANALQGAFALSRSAAVARSATVTICTSGDGEKCSGSKDWARGWVVYEGDSSDVPKDGGDDNRIRVQKGLHESLTFKDSSGGKTYVSFDASGFARDVDGNFQSGSFLICDDREDAGRTRTVFLGAAGSSRVGDSVGVTCVP